MQQIIIKKNIEQSKLEAIIQFLKAMNIEAELKVFETKNNDNGGEFSLSKGMWQDYDIDATEIRKQAWNKGK